MLDMLILLFCQ